MAESVNPLRPDGRLSRSGLDRVGESTSRQESIFGGMPRINVGAGESVVQGPADSFWIRIDAAGANGRYAATEVARRPGQAAGASDQPPGDARKWTLANNPASEVNLSTDVAVNSIHRAWNSGEQGVIEFDASTSSSEDCEACLANLCQVKDADGFVTDVKIVLSDGTEVSLPICGHDALMTCCDPPQPIPKNLTFRFVRNLSSFSLVSGYRASDQPGWLGTPTCGLGSYICGITQQRPPFLGPAPAFPVLRYNTVSDCAILWDVEVPLEYLPSSGAYFTIPNTACSAYVDGGGVLRSIEPRRHRIWTGVTGGLPAALDATVTLYPCFGGGAGFWITQVTLYLVYTRAPFGPCDIDGVVFLQNNAGVFDSTSCFPTIILTFPWNWTWGAMSGPPACPVCNMIQADPCHLARPVTLVMGDECPTYCGQWPIGGCTSTDSSVPDGAVHVLPGDYYGFNVDINGAAFARFMTEQCPSPYIEIPNFPFPQFADPNKTGQTWSYRAEIFE